MNQISAKVITIDVREAETQLLQLLELALKDGEVVITKANIPLARLVPINSAFNRRIAGLHEGAIRLHPDFNAPILDAFGIDAT